MDPIEVRKKINQRIMEIEAPQSSVRSVEDQILESEGRSTQIRIYKPMNSNNFLTILLIHGGAWVAGNLDTHDYLARYLCSQAEAVVISVGYLNAPEGKFPLPLDQCYDALTWATEHLPSSKIAIVGDSAGGNMAAALCLMSRDRKGPKPDLQVLINPATDLTSPDEALQWQARQYLVASQDAFHPYVSPLIANDLSDLPDALVILAEKDALYEDGLKYANRLREANVATHIYCQYGIGHLAGDGARASLRARESIDIAVKAIKQLAR